MIYFIKHLFIVLGITALILFILHFYIYAVIPKPIGFILALATTATVSILIITNINL